MSQYAPLWCHSHHSFLQGASSPEELVERAAELELPALALTDRNGVYGAVRAHVHAKEVGLKLIVGCQIDVRPRVPLSGSSLEHHDPAVLLPMTRGAYERMCQLLTQAHTRGEKGEAWITSNELCEHAGDLVALVRNPWLLDELRDGLGSDLFAFIGRHHQPGEAHAERLLREQAQAFDVAMLGGNQVLYHQSSRRDLQDVLTCIDAGCSLGQAGRQLQPNAEHALRSYEEMAAFFAGDEALLRPTMELAERASFNLDQLRYVYPAERLPEGQTEISWLQELTFRGAKKRYPNGIPDDVRAQLQRELLLIDELDYGGYFLTMHEIVEFCRSEEILCQGRGSAANSAVCYCLGVTAVDPVRMDFLFERFLSRERAEPPDIDLDIEHERREEVIQHVYERYGRRHAAMVANVVRYRAKSAVREIGKVLEIPSTDIDAISRLLSYWSSGAHDQLLTDAGVDPSVPATQHLMRLVGEIQETPRHQSIHPGGFLLGHLPVDRIVPIEPATMEGRTVIQWDKYDVDSLGLFKVDLLGLGALTCIRKAFDLISNHGGPKFSIATVPAEDPATYRQVSTGDTVGVFQIESRAQMAMLPRLQPRTFYDLVIEVAIVRPGPIQGDMVHPYLRRRHGEEPVEYPHPEAKRVLAKTLGVPIFQEQVMKLAVAIAGYSPGESDQLRRDMAAWRRSGRIEKHRERMVPAMVERGVPLEFAERVFSQIRGFGEYGFPESHAASFALLAYVTAWLKCHHPAAFACGLLNSLPMGFYSAATIVEDAKRHGVEVLPIDVLRSQWDCTLELQQDSSRHASPAHELAARELSARELSASDSPAGPLLQSHSPNALPQAPSPLAIRMGLRMINGLGQIERDAIEAAWSKLAQRPTSLATFVRATRLSERAYVNLAESGAFASYGLKRRDALWQVRGLCRARNDRLDGLAPQSQLTFAELDQDEAVLWDYRASNHSTRGHPMERFRQALAKRGLPNSEQVRSLPDGTKTSFVGQVICRQRPGTASGVNFYTLEDEKGFVNLVLWEAVAEKYRVVARTSIVLGVTGKIQRAEGVTHLIADRVWSLPQGVIKDAIETQSRNFH